MILSARRVWSKHVNNTARLLSTVPSGSAPLLPSVAVLLMNNKWVKATEVKATGKGGRLLKGDVLNYLKHNKPPTQGAIVSQKMAHPPTQSARKQSAPIYTDIPTTQMRRVIASRLLESKQNIPHSYMTIEAPLDNFLNHVKTKIKVSVNDLIIYCAARALEKVPECNSVFNAKEGVHQQAKTIDISFAVATEKGLLTPIIPRTNTLTLEQISAKVKDLSTRARENKLKPEEFQGGTFCISNLGMFGVNHFSAVINPPHAIILAVGGSTTKPKNSVPVDDLDAYADNVTSSKEKATDIEFGTFISVTAASDSRAVDGATVARFLRVLKEELSLINTPLIH